MNPGACPEEAANPIFYPAILRLLRSLATSAVERRPEKLRLGEELAKRAGSYKVVRHNLTLNVTGD